MFASKLISATKGRDSSTPVIIVLPLALVAATYLYSAVMESSSWQGTLGKRMLGLCVTDLGGHRVTFGRATGRTFAKYLSGMTAGIGYLLCGFTRKKQGLHHMLTNCLVVCRGR